MNKPAYDRSAEDVGNVLLLEHLNVTVPDQELAALFYVTGLGFTRDPYIDFGTRNMWVNAGETQFHLPKAGPQRFRGTIGIVVPDLEQLHRRLGRLAKPLAGTEFAWTAGGAPATSSALLIRMRALDRVKRTHPAVHVERVQQVDELDREHVVPDEHPRAHA